MSILDHGKQPWASPCKSTCSASSVGDNVCIGCGRTSIEVIEWNSYTQEKRIEINERIKKPQNRG